MIEFFSRAKFIGHNKKFRRYIKIETTCEKRTLQITFLKPLRESELTGIHNVSVHHEGSGATFAMGYCSFSEKKYIFNGYISSVIVKYETYDCH